jgi:hypothetical protein
MIIKIGMNTASYITAIQKKAFAISRHRCLLFNVCIHITGYDNCIESKSI